MNSILMPATSIPVLRESDVCVVGGSCTGVFAAIRAARLGLTVTLCEKQNSFGGVATQGLVTVWHTLKDMSDRRQIIAGLTQETIERMTRLNAVLFNDNRSSSYVLNTEELKIELDDMVRAEKNIFPLFHAPYAAAIKDESGRVTAIVVQTKSGLRAIRAKLFIDATGDGDLLRDAGAAFTLPRDHQPPTPCAKIQGMSAVHGLHKLIFEHGEEFGLAKDWGWSSAIPGSDVTFHADTHVFGVDCADVLDLTKAEFEGRRQIRAMMELVRTYRPECPVTLLDLCAYIGVRETRHFSCLFQLTEAALLGGEAFPDAIAAGTYPIDVHQEGRPGIVFKRLDGTQEYCRDGYPPEKGTWLAPGQTPPPFYQIPYRSMVPRGIDNIIAAGRMIDADRNAYGAVRVMVNANQTGEAAGVAAWCALNAGVGFTGVNPSDVRRLLVEGGSAAT